MVKAKGVKTGLQWKKKKWFEIVAPPQFNNRVIGETMGETPSEVIGRFLEANMMLLAGNIKKQNVIIKLKIHNVKDNRAYTSPVNFHMQSASIKRLIRKNMTKIDDSFCCKTKDNLNIRIRPLLLTRSKAQFSATNELRKLLRNIVSSRVSKLNFNKFIDDLAAFRFQKELKSRLDKVAPLRVCQIKYAGIETRKKTKIVEINKEFEKKLEAEEKVKTIKKEAKTTKVVKSHFSKAENETNPKVETKEVAMPMETKVAVKEETKGADVQAKTPGVAEV